MNRSKSAALLMLVGSFAAGGAVMYTYDTLTTRPAAPNPCPVRSQENYRKNIYGFLEMTPEQRKTWDSLIDERGRAVRDLFAIPRAKEDSIQRDIRARQMAVLNPSQRQKLDERRAEMRSRDSTRRALCDQQQQQMKNKTTTSR
jgi:hypothetical protein